ncbi:dTDP-4-dehydrorhamnose 3,5-epimerase [Candidatus Vallotia lariciata]|uniref:dTDP-4-dehydrorhamnose 3,5-epimerase n=1 Tax=Candidatus Vallotia laricis TaxID=2018052 RepID=UPI001D02400C|nr:dTDP-4-dehydrorhamnose 3,5-epimerase [Candidatus Vallotia lariciata]UDG83244.1 dTDP-4-dehydrorhamnose 3,5-epimerase [Candidatus Vallotia lariciata]
MSIQVSSTSLPDIKLIDIQVFNDERGFLFESFNTRDFARLVDANVVFVQDNHSHSVHGVLRGLHYQIEHVQGKLVRVIHGEVFDVAVDIRQGSSTFGQWVGVYLSAVNRRQLWVPPGFAHGFLTLSNCAEFLYKTTDYRYPNFERRILWNDPELLIKWPLQSKPIVSERDANGKRLCEAELYVWQLVNKSRPAERRS